MVTNAVTSSQTLGLVTEAGTKVRARVRARVRGRARVSATTSWKNPRVPSHIPN